jgi:hypothetical protein
MQYALVNTQDEIVRQQIFEESPPVPNPVKGLAWLQLIETWPTLTANQKLGGVAVTVDRIAGTATKAHLAVDKAAGELAAEAAIAAKAQAYLDNLPSWAAVDSAVTAIANLADAKAFIRKLARVVYWDVKNSAD